MSLYRTCQQEPFQVYQQQSYQLLLSLLMIEYVCHFLGTINTNSFAKRFVPCFCRLNLFELAHQTYLLLLKRKDQQEHLL